MLIRFSEIWKILNLGLLVDWEKKVITIRLGPLTIERIPLPYLRSLSSQLSVIEPILGNLFVSRRVMWIDLKREEPQHVLASLNELSEKANEAARTFHVSSKQADQTVGSILQAWALASQIAAKDLKTAIEMENDPADTGMDTSSRDHMDSILIKLRTEQYPSAEFLITLLPEGNPVRRQAQEKLDEGKKVLERVYSVLSASVPTAMADLES